MKTAIVFYSMLGNTKSVAENIKQKLGENVDLVEVTPVKEYPSKGIKKFLWGGKSAIMSEKPKLNPYEFNSDEYEQVIFGFPVWASRIAPPLRTFIEDNRETLKGKTISAYACQAGNGAEKAFAGLKDLLGISDYKATMILIDPKDKPKEENDTKIEKFCEQIGA